MNVLELLELIRYGRDGRMLDRDTVGNLGNSQAIVLPVNAGETTSVRLLDARAGNPHGAESALLTVGARITNVPAGGFGNYQFIAHLEWGTGTGRVSADVDVVLGARVSVPASVATVDLIALCTAGPVANPPTVNFDAAIAYGNAGKGLPPTLTRTPIVGIPSGGTRQFVVPAFAREVIPIMQGAGDTCEVLQFNQTVAVPASSVTRIPLHGLLTGVGAGNPPTIGIKNTGALAATMGALFFLDL